MSHHQPGLARLKSSLNPNFFYQHISFVGLILCNLVRQHWAESRPVRPETILHFGILFVCCISLVTNRRDLHIQLSFFLIIENICFYLVHPLTQTIDLHYEFDVITRIISLLCNYLMAQRRLILFFTPLHRLAPPWNGSYISGPHFCVVMRV